jgi:hypothetical protein
MTQPPHTTKLSIELETHLRNVAVWCSHMRGENKHVQLSRIDRSAAERACKRDSREEVRLYGSGYWFPASRTFLLGYDLQEIVRSHGAGSFDRNPLCNFPGRPRAALAELRNAPAGNPHASGKVAALDAVQLEIFG